MSYFLYQLQFDAPVHFGAAEQGGGLEQTGWEYPADTLFSALCCELALQQEFERLAHLVDKVERGAIRLSDLFPYAEIGQDTAFFLPKPVLLPKHGRPLAAMADLASVRKAAAARKAQKKARYLRARELCSYAEAMKNGQVYVPDELPEFGSEMLAERVSCRGEEPLPYYVGSFSFAAGAGLYGIVWLENEEDAEWLQRLLELLGISGIGGKRSSGYGKFHLLDDFLELYPEGTYEDDMVLYRLLQASDAPWQMALSVLLPKQEDISFVKAGQYQLKKRSGFIAGENRKKNSLYLVTAGSCMPVRLDGSLVSVSGAAGHPVWRYGKGMYVGLMI